ncbi:trp-interacting inaF-D isoform X2 [Anticarsia gemmatalis]|uniref:trp-interacting inaF-D isoform X2 n=1 Tax=Anticarsia gemmatalis TaxID=129554 RepID=UPI003F7716E8
MSVCGQTGPPEEDSVSEEVGAQLREKTSDIYKQKPASKVVRVLTVLAYLLSVSLAAILLSVYYICVWKSPELPLETSELSARRGNLSDYRDAVHSDEPLPIGGGDTAVNGSILQSPENTTSGSTNMNMSDLTTDITEDTTVLPDTTSPGLLNVTSDVNGSLNYTGLIT